MQKEKAKSLLEILDEVESLPLPQPLPVGQKSIDFSKFVKYPLHYSERLMKKLQEMEAPQEIKEEEKKTQ